MMKKASVALLLFFSISLTISAQSTWDLERCIREALEKSLLIKQFELQKQGSVITGKQLKMERLPNLNASSSLGVSFGRVVNPATNDFETENSFYQSLGLNSGLMLFNGFRLQNSIRQNNLYIDAAEADLQQARNDLALNVALSYLNVLFAYENLEIARDRMALSENQLSNLDKLIAAGNRPENDRYDLLSQVAIDQQSMVTAQNNIEINLLALKQQMWMEPDFPLEIERPEISLDNLEALENETLASVYTAALTSQPQIAAVILREEAGEIGIDIAKSQLYPSLSIGGDIGSNWSDLAREEGGYVTQRIPQHGVYINDEAVDLEYEVEVATEFNTIPYIRQLDNNIGYGFGATLSIPIFNHYSARGNVEKAKINAINANIQADQTRQTLKTNIQNAIASAKAAKQSLAASEAATTAAKIAYDNANRKLELGSLNNFDLLAARNRYDTAENNLLIAKYEYYFRIKVIEYYLGRGIRLN
jgi:outer membrane protein